jgi:hypothetical protein
MTASRNGRGYRNIRPPPRVCCVQFEFIEEQKIHEALIAAKEWRCKKSRRCILVSTDPCRGGGMHVIVLQYK